ncbi:MAG: hypothetical protein AB8I08_33730 [Sandaracinaceae bacterium]
MAPDRDLKSTRNPSGAPSDGFSALALTAIVLLAPSAAAADRGDIRELRVACAATNQYRQENDTGLERSATLARIDENIAEFNAFLLPRLGVSLVRVDAPQLVSVSDSDAFSAAEPFSGGPAFPLRDWIGDELAPTEYDLAIGFVVRSLLGSQAAMTVLPRCGTRPFAMPLAQGFAGDVSSDADLIVGRLRDIVFTIGGFVTHSGDCTAVHGADTNWEPGGGNTLTGSGGCGLPILPGSTFPNPYFHPYLHGGILERVQTALDSPSCGTVVGTNGPPVVTAEGDGLTIPTETPFELSGTATDPDGDPLLFTWEQMDSADTPMFSLADDGVGPVFRSLPPTSSPTRRIPRAITSWELGLRITMERTLSFRLTARDRRPTGGTFGFDDITISAVRPTSPFTLNDPGLLGFGENTITWNVGGTDAAPFSCSDVAVELSTDAGVTFSTVLAASTPNDGNAVVEMPALGAGSGILRVRCTSNLFFAPLDVTYESFECDEAVDCDDGQLCNGSEACESRVCVAGVPLAAGTACGDSAARACDGPDACDGAGVCDPSFAADGSLCDAGAYCTASDQCASGVCIEGDVSPCGPTETCVESTNACIPACGDGTVGEGESCDNGPENSDVLPDACRTDCTAARCGDEVVDSAEECDAGEEGSAVCTPSCAMIVAMPDAGLSDAGLSDAGSPREDADPIGDPDGGLGGDSAGCTCRASAGAGRSAGGLPGIFVLLLLWRRSRRAAISKDAGPNK